MFKSFGDFKIFKSPRHKRARFQSPDLYRMVLEVLKVLQLLNVLEDPIAHGSSKSFKSFKSIHVVDFIKVLKVSGRLEVYGF